MMSASCLRSGRLSPDMLAVLRASDGSLAGPMHNVHCSGWAYGVLMVAWCKPRAGELSRHLFIGNCGPVVGISLDQLAGVLNHFGLPAESLEAPESNQGRVYASFATTDQAAAVVKQSAQLCAALGGRHLIFKYAAVEAEAEVRQACQHARLDRARMLKNAAHRLRLRVRPAAPKRFSGRGLLKRCSYWDPRAAAHPRLCDSRAGAGAALLCCISSCSGRHQAI